jgi:site-specific recombinase XerD
MSNTVTEKNRAADHWRSEGSQLYATDGQRKYLNKAERRRALAVMEKLRPSESLFALVLAWTGARVSEVLALTPASFQIDSSIVTLVTLKRRKHCVREIPIPPALMARLERHFSLRHLQEGGQVFSKLWAWCRVTAWRIIKKVMRLAHIFGRRACPRGLRHGFGIGTLQSGVPLTLIQRWMGHARLSTTGIYATVCGPEEITFARQFWQTGGTDCLAGDAQVTQCAA